MDLLIETEIGDFISTGDLAEDILSITSVHPLREEALKTMISIAGGTWRVVEELLAAEKISVIFYRDERYFLRRFNKITRKE
jgi:hypothetical protein